MKMADESKQFTASQSLKPKTATLYTDSFDAYSQTSDSDDYSDEGEFGAYLTDSDEVSALQLFVLVCVREAVVY